VKIGTTLGIHGHQTLVKKGVKPMFQSARLCRFSHPGSGAFSATRYASVPNAQPNRGLFRKSPRGFFGLRVLIVETLVQGGSRDTQKARRDALIAIGTAQGVFDELALRKGKGRT
jgi:hypothetical protein